MRDAHPGLEEDAMRVRAACVAATAALAVAASTAGAATKILTNGGFEKPKVRVATQIPIDGSLGTCVPGTARQCWLVRPTPTAGAGVATIVPQSVLLPRAGKQSLALGDGTSAVTAIQSFDATEGRTYKVTLWVAGDPAFQGIETMTAFWGNIDQHGNTLPGGAAVPITIDTTGHSPTSMGWTKHTFTVATVPGTIEARLYLQSTTSTGLGTLGPLVDQVSVK
jgi:hypothetical protein